MLEVKDLKVSFGGLTALNLDTFSIRKNELRVIIGPNGAGKSTFMDIVCGKTKPQQGSVKFKGLELLGRKEVEIAKLGVGRKFQKPSIFSGLTVYDNLLLGLDGPKDVFTSYFYKLASYDKDRIMEVAEKVGLVNDLTMIAGSLSHGKKQWLEIAIVMLQDSELMLIDEPAAGMSDVEAEKTGNLLCDLSKKHSVIVIEHDMKFVEQIAIEKVSVLVRGQLLTEGTFQEVRNNQEVIDCYLGSANSAQQKAHS
ncbi:urea transport system ATP-binding protein [Wenyingzhuangia heitensis]|uniref:Urea transport system ATP-binding protein n=1 Tax=Wenyingzhuangia heitensis TaxID=1487859 RepID=A0ABX0UAV9_9FLAO|nr:urea ABC transporter ATP-binding protein UrtD [Wenyingzhuangia heitensis]NIJ45964.1 urea transport system ATP-binding protein [Wenyingzhuangia heitensis]